MKPHIQLLAAVALALSLASCSSDSKEEATDTTTATASTTSSVTTSSTPASSAPAEAQEQFAPGDPRLVPVDAVYHTGLFIEAGHSETGGKHYWVCNGGQYTIADGAPVEAGTCKGPLTYEEGNAINHQWEPVFDRMREEAGLNDAPAPEPAPAEESCPAAECGYGYDENGNPNPSSGEIQTYHGCEDGYINDPELCAAVREKIEG